jgi:hypothetical protein
MGRSPLLPRIGSGGLLLDFNFVQKNLNRSWECDFDRLVASWLAEGNGRDLSPSLGWDVGAVNPGIWGLVGCFLCASSTTDAGVGLSWCHGFLGGSGGLGTLRCSGNG